MYSEEYFVRYFVNKEKGVVVCKLEDCYDSLIADMHIKGYPVDENLEIPNEFIGKAKCSPEDTFDENIGKNIAFNRAMIKLNKAKKKMIESFLIGFEKFNLQLKKDAQGLADRYATVITKKNEDIEKITR